MIKAINPVPRFSNVEKIAASTKAIGDLKASRVLPESVELRQVKYLNTIVEQDHRFIKRLVKPGLGFFSFETAWRTFQGYEAINRMRKGHLQGVEKRDIRSQVTFIATLFGVAVKAEKDASLHARCDSVTNFCNTTACTALSFPAK